MRRWVALLAVLTAPLWFVAVAHADVNNFTITKFSADETLTRTDPQGGLHIVEHVAVHFTDNNHGILRAIPKSYQGQSLKLHINRVSSTMGTPAQYTSSTDNGNLVLRIGDPNRTVTGDQEYTIDYTVQNVMTFEGQQDTLYWDVNGDQWEQPFTQVNVTVHLPADAPLSGKSPKCFVGNSGTATRDDCTITLSGHTLQAATSGLDARQTLTYEVNFKTGYFQPATLADNIVGYGLTISSVALPIVLALVVGLLWWLRSGRDAAGKGTIVPQYEPPAGISPLQAGTIADFKVDGRDLTATFIDLARRGYIRITEQTVQHKLRKDTLNYTLELRNSDWSACSDYEKQLLTGMFTTDPEVDSMMQNAIAKITADTTAGLSSAESQHVQQLVNGVLEDEKQHPRVDLSVQKYQLDGVVKKLRKQVSDDLTAQGYFRTSPYRFAVLSTAAIWVAIASFLLLGIALIVPAVVGVFGASVIMWLFARSMPARTLAGVSARNQLLGLKMYMETAEKDRMAMLEAPGAPYAAGAGTPERTVEFFEKLLPYAIVLGVEDKWAAQFANIYSAAPDWYSGHTGAFSAGYLAGSLHGGFGSAMNASFSSPSSSGGGGFAGGGGGGGGGGGW